MDSKTGVKPMTQAEADRKFRKDLRKMSEDMFKDLVTTRGGALELSDADKVREYEKLIERIGNKLSFLYRVSW